MSAASLLAEREALASAVKAVDAASSVEVVLVVRRRAVDLSRRELLAGIVAGLVVLTGLLFAPWFELAWELFPLLTALAIFVVALAVRMVPPLRRLIGIHVVDPRHLTAARAEFVARGVHRTRDRSGLLIHVGVDERSVVLVPDVGVQTALGPELEQVRHALVRALLNGQGFAAELSKLAPLFAQALPRQHDDENELDDGPILGDAPGSPAEGA